MFLKYFFLKLKQFTSFRMIQQSFIDMENMFELLDESHEVTNCITAGNLIYDMENRLKYEIM